MSVHGAAFDRGLERHLSPPDGDECPTCEGTGEEHGNPSPINDPQCEISGRCSACGGSGDAADVDEVEFEPDFEAMVEARQMRHEPSGDVW